jgi:predicted nucleotidyltransferase/DNA-binding transcriptional ArsR family regulator
MMNGNIIIKYLNVVNITTIDVKMTTLIKEAYWKILKVFYLNRNTPLHLREISRRIKLDQSALTRHLNKLTSERILKFTEEGNLKKFYIHKKQVKLIFPLFDEEKLEALPLLRKNAILFYLKQLNEKPVFSIVFGSSAKGSFREDSDVDIISVFNKKTNTINARKYSESQTGIHISEFQLTYKEFIKELKMKENHVIQAGIETGFPVSNNKEYYGIVYDE